MTFVKDAGDDGSMTRSPSDATIATQTQGEVAVPSAVAEESDDEGEDKLSPTASPRPASAVPPAADTGAPQPKPGRGSSVPSYVLYAAVAAAAAMTYAWWRSAVR
jgi:hypothetical protein